MTPDEAREKNVGYLVASAEESLESAKSELAAGRRRFSINRVYYACFYMASAVLLAEARHFVKHAGVRSALHEHLVNKGRLATSWGDFYDEMFQARHQGDYGRFVVFDPAMVSEAIQRAEAFVTEMKRLLGSASGHSE